MVICRAREDVDARRRGRRAASPTAGRERTRRSGPRCRCRSGRRRRSRRPHGRMLDAAAEPEGQVGDDADDAAEDKRGGDPAESNAPGAEPGEGQAPVSLPRGGHLEEGERPAEEGRRPAGADRGRRLPARSPPRASAKSPRTLAKMRTKKTGIATSRTRFSGARICSRRKLLPLGESRSLDHRRPSTRE